MVPPFLWANQGLCKVLIEFRDDGIGVLRKPGSVLVLGYRCRDTCRASNGNLLVSTRDEKTFQLVGSISTIVNNVGGVGGHDRGDKFLGVMVDLGVGAIFLASWIGLRIVLNSIVLR